MRGHLGMTCVTFLCTDLLQQICRPLILQTSVPSLQTEIEICRIRSQIRASTWNFWKSAFYADFLLSGYLHILFDTASAACTIVSNDIMDGIEVGRDVVVI